MLKTTRPIIKARINLVRWAVNADDPKLLASLQRLGYLQNRAVKAYVWAILNKKQKAEAFLLPLIIKAKK